MMHTLLGIHEYYQYTSNNNAKHLFDQGIVALKNDLSLCDDNGYSYYDILGNPAQEYHNVHFELSDQFYNIIKEKTLKEYHDNCLCHKQELSWHRLQSAEHERQEWDRHETLSF
jgi:hypothetical protein